jgi:hypothetical protein
MPDNPPSIQPGSISTGDISDSVGVGIGQNVTVTVSQASPASAELALVLAQIRRQVDALPDGPSKKLAATAVQGLEAEAKKGEKADEKAVSEWFRFLAETAGDAWEVAVTTFVNPIAGVGKVFQLVAARAKADKAEKKAGAIPPA